MTTHGRDDRATPLTRDHEPWRATAITRRMRARLTMLVPLGVLALGAIVAGFVFNGAFIGHSYDAFWKGALFTAKDNHILDEIHDVPAWVVAGRRSS